MLHFYLLILLFSCFKGNDKLIFVQTHFRHGARSPTVKKNNVDSVGEPWEYSMQLTGVGKRMHYILGLRNRIKYIIEGKLISEKYLYYEVEAYSSNTERTIMSLLSHLQGLYPQSEKLGDNLTEAQSNDSNPPVNVNYSRISEEFSYLQNDALPQRMTTVYFNTIKANEGNNIYETSCKRIKNSKSSSNNESILITKEFTEQFGDYINKFNERKSYNYTFSNIESFCDSLIASYKDKRNMTKLRNTGINIEELYKICLDVKRIEYKYMNNNISSFIKGSKLMKMVVDGAKKRIDRDINGTYLNEPKMLIISGHDTSVAVQELFLIYSLGLNLDNFRGIQFASQIALLFTRKDDDKKNRTYSDYFVNYYFDDELLFNITANEFFNKIEAKIWSDEEINVYCNSNDTKNNSNNSDIDNNDNSYILFSNKKYKKRTTALIVFICLFAVSFIINLIQAICLLRKNNKILETDNTAQVTVNQILGNNNILK